MRNIKTTHSSHHARSSVSVDRGETVTLTATPDAGSTFEGWTGCDSASGATCTCTMSASRTVTASFAGCSVASVSVQDAVAVVNNTAVLTAVVTAGSCSPSLEVDWTTYGCPDARVVPSGGVTRSSAAPPRSARLRAAIGELARERDQLSLGSRPRARERDDLRAGSRGARPGARLG
jgi:hypothetical protein